jgi:WD40 repeat protein
MGGWRSRVALLTACAAAAVPSATAMAAFPGENGRIAFWSAQFEGCCEGNLVDGTWTIEPDGTGATLLIEGANEPAWSPDGSKLAYVRAAGEGYDVYTATADGSGERRLTDDGHLDLGPSWSPDGSSIVWASDRDGTSQIWVMAADGTGARRVTSLPAGSNPRSPRWSPLGDEIAYWTFGDGPAGVRIVGADGTADRLVTPAGFEARTPDWAPDASRLVFASRQEQVGSALYTIRPDGTDMRRIPNLQGGSFGAGDGMGIGSPTFSPDGTKLLYHYIVCFIGRCGEGIVLAEADGSAQRTLTGGVRFENFGTGVWQPLIPNRPPDCSGVGADPSSLWPPNKHLRTVSLSGATDPDGDDVTLRVTGVTHDEGGAAGWQPGALADQVLLRAERNAKGDGRVYEIAFEATDEHGASCTGEVNVTVPRHNG